MTDPTILLLQARLPEDPMKAQELTCFAGTCALPATSFVSHDLLEGPPTLAEARRHDALMIGGSGDFLVSAGEPPGLERTLGFLNEVVETSFPTFASCFGFQLLVAARSGEVVYDPETTEVGTYPLRLTAAGRDDELLGRLPSRFDAQMGRKDRARRLPPGIVNLARSERCPYQAFRVPGAPIWATQFHPELGARENRARFENYLENYRGHLSPEERRRALDRFHDSPETAELLPRFLELVLDWAPARRRLGGATTG